MLRVVERCGREPMATYCLCSSGYLLYMAAEEESDDSNIDVEHHRLQCTCSNATLYAYCPAVGVLLYGC
jgi:hypothetical protein